MTLCLVVWWWLSFLSRSFVVYFDTSAIHRPSTLDELRPYSLATEKYYILQLLFFLSRFFFLFFFFLLLRCSCCVNINKTKTIPKTQQQRRRGRQGRARQCSSFGHCHPKWHFSQHTFSHSTSFPFFFRDLCRPHSSPSSFIFLFSLAPLSK